MPETAFWVGRFQPPTNAHLLTAQCILEKWRQLVIGIVHQSPAPKSVDPKWLVYLAKPESNTLQNEKNPFLPEEVTEMWSRALERIGHRNRVTLVTMPRIAYQTDFNSRFPKSQFDFVEVTPNESDSSFDWLRGMTFEQLLERQVHYISPPFKLHNAQIRSLIAKGSCAWSDVLPSGCYEVFVAIGGPSRL